MQRVEVRLLGGFGVWVDGRVVPDGAWPKRSGADLVKLLALAPGRRLSRDEAVEALWPHLGADAGTASLHKAATYARSALGDRGAVVLESGVLELAPGAEVVTDVERFLAGDDSAYGGELVPDDRYADWATAARDRVRERRLELLRREGRWERVLDEDPADEEAHRALMRRHAAADDRVGVARQFARVRRELANAGIQPSEETLALRRELTRGPAVRASVSADGPMIGRERQFAAAEDVLRSAASGEGGAVLVMGATGMGKTRFLEALLDRAGEIGFHTLRGAGAAEEGRTPYAPMREALEPLAEERPDLPAALGEDAEAAATQLLGGRLRQRGGAAADRHRSFSAVGQLLSRAAAERGVLLVLDDLDAADETSAALFHYLARGAVGQRLVVAAAIGEPPLSEPVERVRASLLRRRGVLHMELDDLDRHAVGALANRAAKRPLAPEALSAIQRIAGGNPFFVEELAGAVDAAGALVLPGRLAEVVERRLDRLLELLGDFAPPLAVLEDGFTAGEVAALAAGRPKEAAAALEGASDAGALERGRGGYRLRHAILRTVLAERIGSERLRQMHAEAARLLGEQEAPPEQVAHHLVRAGREDEAVPLLRDAARWAADVGAYRDGLAWAERALEHADAGARSDLLALRADLCLGAGDPRAASAYRIAIDCAPAEQAPALRVRQARARLAGGDVDGAAEALAAAQPRTHRDRASLLVWRGIVAWHRGDLDDARRCAAEAETLGSEAVRVTELRALLAHADGRFDHHAQLELSESWRDPELAGRVFDAYLCVTERVLRSGEPVERLALFAKRLRVEARQAGALRGESFAATVLGEAELLTGNLAVARDLLVEGARLSREAGSAGAEALARLRLGEALLHLGDRAAASVQLDEALELAHVPTLARHLLFLVYGVLVQIPGDPAETLGVVDRAEQLFDPRWLCRTCPLDFWLGAATAAARAGEHERADGYVTRVRHGAGAWQRGPVRAVLAEAEGELLLARGVRAEGRARLALAVDGYAAAGHRLREARARATLASS